jgi:hypothetical protein
MITALVRRAAVLSIASVLLLPSAGAAAGPAVSGSGFIQFGTSSEHVTFTGGQGPSGGQEVIVVDRTASGTVVMRIAVNCVRIVGNEATVSGIVTRSSEPMLEGFEALFQVRDNGQGGGLRDQMSSVLLHAVGTGPDCTVPGEFDLVPLQGGNFDVSS